MMTIKYCPSFQTCDMVCVHLSVLVHLCADMGVPCLHIRLPLWRHGTCRGLEAKEKSALTLKRHLLFFFFFFSFFRIQNLYHWNESSILIHSKMKWTFLPSSGETCIKDRNGPFRPNHFNCISVIHPISWGIQKNSAENDSLRLHNALRWRHNEHDSVSNHQPHDCLLNHLFGRRSK